MTLFAIACCPGISSAAPAVNVNIVKSVPLTGSVTITGTPSVSVTNTVPVTGSVAITGTPSVSVTNTVPVTGSVAISGTPVVSVSSLPPVGLAAGTTVAVSSNDDQRVYTQGFSFNTGSGASGAVEFLPGSPSVLQSLVMSCTGGMTPMASLTAQTVVTAPLTILDGVTGTPNGVSTGTAYVPVDLPMTIATGLGGSNFFSLNVSLGIPVTTVFGLQMQPDGSGTPFNCKGLVTLRKI
jgi:hypothetical protein